MKKKQWTNMLGLALILVFTESGFCEQSSLNMFDAEIAVCRRIIRQSCAIVQQMATSKTVDKEQQSESLRMLTEARKLFADIQSKYGSNPPVEYAKDKTFKARLDDIGNALEDMEKALVDSDARRSFLACGFACGLFVKMHEEYGLNYALDKLYHMRDNLKITMVVIKTLGPEAVWPRLPELLQKRDAVLMAPPPFPPDHENTVAYNSAIAELSRTTDILAQAGASRNSKQVEELLAKTLSVLNKAYGIAL